MCIRDRESGSPLPRISFSIPNSSNNASEDVWHITSGGHLLPSDDDTYDIGSAQYKVRDMYVADSSLWVGENKIDIDAAGVMKRRKRKVSGVPKSVRDLRKNTARAASEAGKRDALGAIADNTADEKILDEIRHFLADDTLEFVDLTLENWLDYTRTIDGQEGRETTAIFDTNVPEDWEEFNPVGIVPDPGDSNVGKILKVNAQHDLEYVDECCPTSATTSSEGTVILTNGNSPVDSSNDPNAVITVTSVENIPLTHLDSSGFTLDATADIDNLAAVATSGAYSDLTGTPTAITNNNQLTNGAGYTTNAGDITGITAGNGLSGGGTSGDVSLELDFSELTNMTGTMDSTDEFIILDSGTGEKRKAAQEIGLSIFNNDVGLSLIHISEPTRL